MRANVIDIFADVDIETYVSVDPTNDGMWIQVIVGPAGERGEESFQVCVCTPLWIRDVVEKEGPQIGRHHLIVHPFDLRTAVAFLIEKFERIEEKNWLKLAEKLGRIGEWELEDDESVKE